MIKLISGNYLSVRLYTYAGSFLAVVEDRVALLKRSARYIICITFFAVAEIVNADELVESNLFRFTLPQQRADRALTQVANIANITLIFPFDKLKSIKTNAIDGEYSAKAALEQLMSNTGYEVVSMGSDGHLSIVLTKISDGGVELMHKLNKIAATVITMAAASSVSTTTLAQENDIVEEVVVTGIRSSFSKANDLKRFSNSIQDSIVAEDLGKFPDQNVAESLQRITGVTISRSNGEGSEVTVRGFGPEFNVVRVNGRALATTDDGRSFDFQVLPSGLISGADIVKAARADIEAGSVGAYININTARPLDNPGLGIAGSVEGIYNDLGENFDPNVSLSYSNTFADDTVGVALGLTYRENRRRIDKFRTNRWHEQFAPPTNLTGPVNIIGGGTAPGFRRPGRAVFEVQEEDRQRTGINGVLQWAPNDNATSTIDLLYSKLDRGVFSQGVQIPTQSTFYDSVLVDDDLTIVSGNITENNIDGLYRELDENSETFAIGFNQKYETEKFTLEFDAAHSTADSNPTVNEFVPHFTFNDNGPERQISLDYGQGDVLNTTSTIDVANIDNIRIHWNGLNNFEIEDEINEFKIKGEYQFENGTINSIEGGVSFLDREKSSLHFDGRSIDGCSPCGGIARFSNPSAIFGTQSFDGFLSNESGVFPRQFITLDNVDEYKAQILESRAANNIAGNPFEPQLSQSSSFVNEEETFSIYSQLNLSGETSRFAWSGNVGVRYVSTDSTSRGFGTELVRVDLSPFSGPQELRLTPTFSPPTDLESSTSDSNVLPSANFSFDFGNGLFVKVGGGTTIARPAIQDTGVNQNITVNDTGIVIITGSNPQLEPYKVNQLDLSFEYYAENDSAYSVAFFHKDITDFISTVTTTSVFDGVVDPAALARTPNGNLVQNSTIKENRSGGTVSGIELAALHYFDYLPGFWGGFGVQANYTYSDSNDSNAETINLPAITDAGSVVEGFAKQSFNLVGFYERNGFQARLAYNYRSEFLRNRDGAEADIASGLPVHTDDYGQLDGSISYDINDSLTVFLEGINLSDEKRVDFVDIRSRVTEVEYAGSRFTFGVRGSF